MGLPVFLSRMMDESHTLVLNGLLAGVRTPWGLADSLRPAPEILGLAKEEFGRLSNNLHRKVEEFREVWTSRLQPIPTIRHLRANGWIREVPDGFALSGKGTTADANKLYQISLQDMVVEGLRILSWSEGIVQGIQGVLSRRWYSENLTCDLAKLPACFEAGLRGGEAVVFGNIRRAMGATFGQLFVEGVGGRRMGAYRRAEELYAHIALPWYKPWENSSGHEGFMRFFTAHLLAWSRTYVDWNHRKWILFLGGWRERGAAPTAIPRVEAVHES